MTQLEVRSILAMFQELRSEALTLPFFTAERDALLTAAYSLLREAKRIVWKNRYGTYAADADELLNYIVGY